MVFNITFCIFNVQADFFSGGAPCGGLGGEAPRENFCKKRTFWSNLRGPE